MAWKIQLPTVKIDLYNTICHPIFLKDIKLETVNKLFSLCLLFLKVPWLQFIYNLVKPACVRCAFVVIYI